MAKIKNNKLFAFMNGESVGILIYKNTGELEFQYETEWLESTIS